MGEPFDPRVAALMLGEPAWQRIVQGVRTIRGDDPPETFEEHERIAVAVLSNAVEVGFFAPDPGNVVWGPAVLILDEVLELRSNVVTAYPPAHDDEHGLVELAHAGALFALLVDGEFGQAFLEGRVYEPAYPPWAVEEWHRLSERPGWDARLSLIHAIQFAVAAIECIDRKRPYLVVKGDIPQERVDEFVGHLRTATALTVGRDVASLSAMSAEMEPDGNAHSLAGSTICHYADCVLQAGHYDEKHGSDHMDAGGSWFNFGQTSRATAVAPATRALTEAWESLRLADIGPCHKDCRARTGREDAPYCDAHTRLLEGTPVSAVSFRSVEPTGFEAIIAWEGKPFGDDPHAIIDREGVASLADPAKGIRVEERDGKLVAIGRVVAYPGTFVAGSFGGPPATVEQLFPGTEAALSLGIGPIVAHAPPKAAARLTAQLGGDLRRIIGKPLTAEDHAFVIETALTSAEVDGADVSTARAALAALLGIARFSPAPTE